MSEAEEEDPRIVALYDLVTRARAVSPSATMCVYLVDVERALGLTPPGDLVRKIGMKDRE